MRSRLRAVRICLVSLLALPLGACWVSERPLLAPGDSAHPLPSARYDYHTYGTVQEITLVQVPGGGYLYAVEEDDSNLAFPVLLKKIADRWHILQIGAADAEVLYGLAHVGTDQIEIYDPDCPESIEEFEGVTRSSGDCNFESLAAMIEAARRTAKDTDAGLGPEPIGWLSPKGHPLE